MVLSAAPVAAAPLIQINIPLVPGACAAFCGNGGPTRLSREHAVPMASRKSGATSSRETCPHAASFSSIRGAPRLHRCCEQRLPFPIPPEVDPPAGTPPRHDGSCASAYACLMRQFGQEDYLVFCQLTL